MIPTEKRNQKTMNIDTMPLEDSAELIIEENINALKALKKIKTELALACKVTADAVKNGGRLIYIGAGTSGRLGVLDASECPPTFGVNENTVVGIIAGGDRCLRAAAENAEDSAENAVKDLQNITLTNKDVVVGISASGNADYIVYGLKYAKQVGAFTMGISSNPNAKCKEESNIFLFTDTKAEPITGSTRMKAGTAQKVVLNILSTLTMVQNGYVKENLMINLKPSNIKLKERVIRITCDILKCNRKEAIERLNKNDWNIRRATEQ